MRFNQKKYNKVTNNFSNLYLLFYFKLKVIFKICIFFLTEFYFLNYQIKYIRTIFQKKMKL